LQQIFTSKNNIENAQYEMLEIIFSIYDYDGDDNLNEEEFITFMSDILYISVLMNRIPENEYHSETVGKIAKWCSSNFKTNLFRTPLPSISHDLFIEGIVYALTENRNLPLYKEQRFTGVSFVTELTQYFQYYSAIAKRRGWPIEISDKPQEQEQEQVQVPFQNTLVPTTSEPICIITKQKFIEYQNSKQNLVIVEEPVKPQLTPQQQLQEYQEMRRKKFQEAKEIEERRKKEMEDEVNRALASRLAEQERINQMLREQQERIEAEQREQERINIEMDAAEQLRERIQQIEQLQRALRDRTRQQGYDLGIDQIDGEVFVKPLDHIETITISNSEEGFDPIEANVNVLDFLDEEPDDRIAFKCGESYYMASRERIRSMINLENRENALFYGCACELHGDWTLIETWALLEPTVISNPVYYNIQQLGLPIRYVYLDDIKQVLESKYRFFSVERPEDYHIIPSFASDNILNHGIGSSSGSHCQDGQADGVYRIKSFEPKII